MEGTLDGYVI